MVISNTAEILNKFRQVLKVNSEIRLVNAYKGIPISNDARILDVSENTLTLKTHRYQIVCLSKFLETYLQSGWLPLTVKARALKVDFLTDTAVLSEFDYVAGNIGSRMLVRVMPRESVDVLIQNEDIPGKIRTELVDLSMRGLGIHIMSELFQPRACREGKSIVCYLGLPIGSKEAIVELRIPGTIVHSEPAGWFRGQRIGVMLFPDNVTKQKISQYVSQRQSEIYNEIKLQYELMSRFAEKGSRK